MKKQNVIKLMFVIMLSVIVLIACRNEPTVFESVEFELPEFTVEANEIPTGYYNIYNIETDEVNYEDLTSDELDELELDDNYEARPIYTLPTFTLTLELSDEAETLVPITLITETDVNGIATFENVIFDEAGTFTYNVWQTTDIDDFEYWELDETVHTFVIEVTENEELEILEATLVDEVDFVFINLFTYEAEEIIEDENDALDDDDEETNTADVPETTETSTSANTNNNSATPNNNSNNISNNNNTPTQNVVNNNNTATNNVPNNNNQPAPSTPTPPPAPICRNVWVETSPVIPATPGTIIQATHYYVVLVLPNRTEFTNYADANAYMMANYQTSTTTVRRTLTPSQYIPGTPAVPAQGHYEQFCD